MIVSVAQMIAPTTGREAVEAVDQVHRVGHADDPEQRRDPGEIGPAPREDRGPGSGSVMRPIWKPAVMAMIAATDLTDRASSTAPRSRSDRPRRRPSGSPAPPTISAASGAIRTTLGLRAARAPPASPSGEASRSRPPARRAAACLTRCADRALARTVHDVQRRRPGATDTGVSAPPRSPAAMRGIAIPTASMGPCDPRGSPGDTRSATALRSEGSTSCHRCVAPAAIGQRPDPV